MCYVILFAFIFISKHIMQTLHYDSNDKMNKKEYNFLYSLDRLSSGSTNNTIKKIVAYNIKFLELFVTNKVPIGKWTICCWQPILSKKCTNNIPNNYQNFFILESLGITIDISSKTLNSCNNHSGYGGIFLASIIRHGTSIPYCIVNRYVVDQDEDSSWIPFSWGRAGG